MLGIRKANRNIDDKLGELWLHASSLVRKRELESASAVLKQIIRINPRNASAHNRLGIIYAKKRKYRRAVRHFRKALRHEPSAAAEHNLGLIYYELGEYKASSRHFENAIAKEDLSLPTRHIALAKAYEKQKEYDRTLEQLAIAQRLEPTLQTKQLYYNAYVEHKAKKQLSQEVIEALDHNKIPWNYEAISSYPILLEKLEYLCRTFEFLTYSRPSKHLSPRSINVQNLTIIYLHDLNACLFLLKKNYSLAAADIARSMAEIYIRIGYSLHSKTNRGFAELELTTLLGKFSANNRLLKKLDPSSQQYSERVALNKQIARTIKSLRRKYKDLKQVPSYREMSLLIDGGKAGNTYRIFEDLYEKGSDVIHAEKNSAERTRTLSGTKHAGIFVDSHELLSSLIELTSNLAELYQTLPELTKVSRQKYDIRERKINQIEAIKLGKIG